MKLFYISPSVLPSRTANSIHVVHQCNALQKFEHIQITLFAVRSISDSITLNRKIEFSYGIKLNRLRLTTFFNRLPFGNNIFICFFSLYYLIKEKLPDVIISRNLYASFLISILFPKNKLFYETHELERGVYKFLQKWIIAHPQVTTIVISKKLKNILLQKQDGRSSDIHVLHDAAPEGLTPKNSNEKKITLHKFFKEGQIDDYNMICGYFGHLYPGRGIEIIFKLAKRNRQHAFLICGGNEIDISLLKRKYLLNNLLFIGFIPHSNAQELMAACDVLLMPYQNNVSIGKKSRDTSGWMSPMKMFEYLASGTPLISSDLPVLREILKNNHNSILVPPTNVEKWNWALNRIFAERDFANRIGLQGHKDYLAKYTWTKRAEKYIDIIKSN